MEVVEIRLLPGDEGGLLRRCHAQYLSILTDKYYLNSKEVMNTYEVTQIAHGDDKSPFGKKIMRLIFGGIGLN